MGLLKRIWDSLPGGGAEAVAEDYAVAFANDNINEQSLSVAYAACPCTCASRDDVRKAIAAYLANEKRTRERGKEA